VQGSGEQPQPAQHAGQAVFVFFVVAKTISHHKPCIPKEEHKANTNHQLAWCGAVWRVRRHVVVTPKK
jgi:hypothetical protein